MNFNKIFIHLIIILFFSSLKAQSIHETLASLSQDAAIEYSEPVITAFGSGLNAGWFSGLPSASNGIHAKLRFVGVGTLFRNDVKRFSTTGNFRFTEGQVSEILSASGFTPHSSPNYNEIKNELLEQDWEVTINGPTINGDKEEHVQIFFPGGIVQGENIQSYTVTLEEIGGFLDNQEFLPTPAMQLDLSSFLGTGVSFRYFKGIDIYDLGQINIWGGGLVHNINYWFEEEFPIDIGFGYYFQKFDVGDNFTNSASQFGIYLSKQFGSVISVVPYASLTYESSKTDINYTYEFDTPAGTQSIDVLLDYDKDSTVGVIIGTTINMAILSLNFDFKLAKTQTGTVALGFGF